MTTEIEEQFYKTFGVEPIKYVLPLGQNFYWQDGSRIMQEADYKMFKIIENDLTEEDKKLVKFIYPEITDRKLLEMICIYSKYTIFCLPINAGDFEEKWTYEKLKNYILKELICLYKANIYNTNQKLQSNIQQLFKEEE